jgi:regulator of sigma E protease
MQIVQYVFALIVTLGVLVTVHELGHFLVARWSGAKVVRFSIGFGPSLFSRFDRRGTEFVVAAIPIGGYVKILDEREGEVAPHEVAKTFNRLSPTWRIAFALGGPVANFLLAIAIYWALFVAGSTDVVPIIDEPSPETPAFAAGLRGGDEIVSVDGAPTQSWAEISMALASRLGDSGSISIESREPGADRTDQHRMVIANWQRGADEPELFRSLGMVPTLTPILGTILDDGPAKAAGLQTWDRVLSVDGKPIEQWGDWVDVLRASPGKSLTIEFERDGMRDTVLLTPSERTGADGNPYGYVGVAPLMREVKYGVFAAIPMSLHETASKTMMTLDLMKKMVTGLVSTRNLSGPITIAKVAGDSARSGGWESFLRVLALLSISLGVLNLLPIPILDGGHIMFCLAEIVIRKPVPDRVQAWGMQIGLAIVGGMMLLAFYNDITRLF